MEILAITLITMVFYLSIMFKLDRIEKKLNEASRETPSVNENEQVKKVCGTALLCRYEDECGFCESPHPCKHQKAN